MENIERKLPILSAAKLVSYHHFKLLFIGILLCVYSGLYAIIFMDKDLSDYASFYSANEMLHAGGNPYQVFTTTYLPIEKKIPACVNPPIGLWLFTPFTWFSYKPGLIIWSIFSFILGLMGAGVTFKYAFSAEFLQKNKLILYLIYLSLYPIMMDKSIAQVGSVLLFFIMYGYHFYVKNRKFLAGLMWGAIIAIKLFPALLFFYVLVQRRYKLFLIMLSVFLLLSLLPIFLFGIHIYQEYFAMLPRISWYGDSWNASIYGFLYRLFDYSHKVKPSWFLVEAPYLILFCISLIWYLKKIREKEHAPVQSFCLTLVMMLLMSPFGWIYYFTLLILPISLTYANIDEEKNRLNHGLMWAFCLFLLVFPNAHYFSDEMYFLGKLTIYSVWFYGLLLLAYLTGKIKSDRKLEIKVEQENNGFCLVIIAFVTWDILATMVDIGTRLLRN